jgi:hypothetical protein
MMAQQLEPVTFDEFLSNAASIFDQIERDGKDVLVEHEAIKNKKEKPRYHFSGQHPPHHRPWSFPGINRYIHEQTSLSC